MARGGNRTTSLLGADAAEGFWIDHYNTSKGPGYNLTPPGERHFAELTAGMSL